MEHVPTFGRSRQFTADERTEGESQAKGSADEPHPARHLFRAADVANVGTSNCNVAVEEARQEACENGDEKGGCQPKQRETEGVAHKPDHQNGTPSDAVRQAPPKRGGQKLGHWIGRHHQTDPQADGGDVGFHRQVLDQIGEEWNNDTETDHVNEGHKKENQELPPDAFFFPFVHAPPMTVPGFNPFPVHTGRTLDASSGVKRSMMPPRRSTRLAFCSCLIRACSMTSSRVSTGMISTLPSHW